jgi:iduronate 2-sulfatase
MNKIFRKLSYGCLIPPAVAMLGCSQQKIVHDNEKPNVLMIIIDDLRTELNCYGANRVISPNIDKLSQEGITFLNAYCQASLCVPSRQSLLTGTRPNTFGAEFETHFRKKLPDCITLPQQFRKNGYRAESFGKVFHHRDDISWDIPSWVPTPSLCYPIYGTKENIEIQKEHIKQGNYVKKDSLWWAKGNKLVYANLWESPDVIDNQLFDGMITEYAIDRLEKLKDSTFFMAVGFFLPHIPFIAPRKYYDMYPLNSITLPVDSGLPYGAPQIAKQPDGEWRGYPGVVKKGMPDEITKKEYIRGYLASISYVDAQVGKLLNRLKELDLKRKTIIVLIGDNGYHLFDKASFGKETNFENGTRVPLIIKPINNKNKGIKTHSLVELLDIYPTLCELAKIPIPPHVQGISFAETLKNPSFRGKEAAYSQINRRKFQGNSVRTARYRYTEWKSENETFRELYDYVSDPIETENKIMDPNYQKIVLKMSNLLQEKFK